MRANDIDQAPRSGSSRRGAGRHEPLRAVGVAIALCLAAACTAPARTTSAYQEKAADTAEGVVSAARTVLLAAAVGDERRSFPQTIAVTIADAEVDAESARDAFESIQPPDAASDEIRATLLPTVDHAIEVIQLVRITARRAEVGSLSQVAAPLEGLADDLDGFATRYG